MNRKKELNHILLKNIGEQRFYLTTVIFTSSHGEEEAVGNLLALGSRGPRGAPPRLPGEGQPRPAVDAHVWGLWPGLAT